VFSLADGEAEIIDAIALETSPLVDKPLGEANLPEGVIIGAVYRDGKVIKPDGETQIRARDRVVIFARTQAVRQVEQLFRVSLQFF